MKKAKSKVRSPKGEILPPQKKKKTLLQFLEEKTNVNKLLDSVHLDEDRLMEAALEQPDLMLDTGRFRVQRLYKRVLLESRLDLCKARVGLKFRRIKTAAGGREFTEAAVKERIELDPKVQSVQKKYNQALALEEMSKLMSEVFRTRSDSLRIIVQSGKLSVHAKELELLRINKKLGKAVANIRESWQQHNR